MNVDIFDSVERHGWVPVEWNANESLHALVDVLNLNTSYCEMVPAEQTTTLVAMCQDTARPGSKSALRGLTAFPPHTDGASKRKPPLLMMLRCLTAPSGCPTYLLSRHAIELEDSLRIGLSVGLWVCRGLRRPHLSAVLDGSRIRWDEDCMRPLDQLARRSHETFRNLLTSTPMRQHNWTDLDTVLVVDNWQTLHARGPVHRGYMRKLERLYIGVR